MGQIIKILSNDQKLPIINERTEFIIKEAGNFTLRTLKIPIAIIPLYKLLATERDVTQPEISIVLDDIFSTFYTHPMTKYTRKLTTHLRDLNLIPNEEMTEGLIRFVVNQSIARSPVPIPDIVVQEFWAFFHELFCQPELRGLIELNLDIVRVLLRTYEPLIVDIINLIKETRRVNQQKWKELRQRLSVIQGDITIIKRQIKALRYIKPFFQTDPRDFATQAQIVAKMVREFGPFFIKMAQVAAANSDFLPEEISQELMVFQEDVPPMAPEEVEEVFQECLNKSPHECYFEFNPKKPIKSGSIGSIYLAKKPVKMDGKEVLIPVIVKVGRKNLDREFLLGKTVIGLAIISSQYWAPHSRLAPFLEALVEQVDEFVDGFQQELNLEDEAINQTRFAQRSLNSIHWSVPKVFKASKKILEMEYLEGAVSMNSALRNFHFKDKERFQRKVAEKFIYTVLNHMWAYNEFHGDLHPGNILVDKNAGLYLIDWGNCVDMTGKWKPVWDYIVGALSADVKLLTEALINISTNPEENRSRRDQIEQTLTNTINKKRITPMKHNLIPHIPQDQPIAVQDQVQIIIGFVKNVIIEMPKRWLEELHQRAQVIMQLMSNTQQLGVVVKSEYMHLSRSFAALIGSYANFYDGLPQYLMITDLIKFLAQFPVHIMYDHLEKRKNEILAKAVITLPLPLAIKNRYRTKLKQVNAASAH